MDPRDRAEAALARARARGAHVVTPDDAVSPMDAANTLQIPRVVVDALDSGSPDTTMILPAEGKTQPLRTAHQQAVQQQVTQQNAAQQAQQQAQQRGAQQRAGQQPGQQKQPTQPLPAQSQQQLPPAQSKPMTQYIQAPGARQQPPTARPPEEDQQPRDLGGLVPTVQQPGTQRSMMSRRLDGQ